MKFLTALTAVALVATPAFAGKIICRNAKGQIAKASECPGKAAPAVAASADTASLANTKKDAKGRCHWTTTAGKHKAGQIVKCP